MPIEKITNEMYRLLERSQLWQDTLSKVQFEAQLAHWISELKSIENEHAQELDEAVFDAHNEDNSEIRELREAVADLEERIRKAKDIL